MLPELYVSNTNMGPGFWVTVWWDLGLGIQRLTLAQEQAWSIPRSKEFHFLRYDPAYCYRDGHIGEAWIYGQVFPGRRAE